MNWRALPRRAFPYLIAAVGGFLIAYVAVFLFAFPAEVLPDDGILPKVVGKTFEDASAILQKTGFVAQQGESRYHKDIPANIVLQQDPPAGSRQKRGTSVVLALSAGQKTAEVPVTSNMSQQQARIAIENTGLTMGNVSEQLSDSPRGLVITSSPPPGTKLDLPGSVDIVLSKGPATIQVPDLYGRSVGEARSMVEQLGLRIAGISRDTSSLQPENTIIRQLPAAGQTVSAGGALSLTVSHFPPPPSIRIDTAISAPPP
ncbi:MAG: eukaryotic-like serine/threonine-protein kinase [Gemmatimonadaceae bacterium]|nr:eukaryotic-like serine/threonine-protein kinase [Gemmatimonadaceae bacterium]